MPLSSKTLVSTVVLLVCIVGAGVFLRASSLRDTSIQVASSATAPQSPAVQTVQILETQLGYAAAEVTQAESQRAAAQALALVLAERLRAFRPDSDDIARELGEQLTSATTVVARLDRQLAVSQDRVVELTGRLRAARAAAGI